MNKLSTKEKKYVTAIVRGSTKQQAGLKAGAKTPVAASKYANRMSKDVKIRQAIDEALAKADLTPEHAIMELKYIVDQNKEIGAKRLAIKDVLELHGYNAKSAKTTNLNINNGFFAVSRDE